MTGPKIYTPEEIEANWARHRAQRQKTQAPPPRTRNVQQVLDLGNLTVLHFQGRQYGVPSVPYKVGLEFVRVAEEVTAFQKITRTNRAEYEALLTDIARLIWRNCYPLRGRWLKRLGLLRNPFLGATEADLGEVIRFFDKCRTRSSVLFQTTTTPSGQRTA
jgi:hypothetical protein